MQKPFTIDSARWRPHAEEPYRDLPMTRGLLHVHAKGKGAEAVLMLDAGPHVVELMQMWMDDRTVDVSLCLATALVDDQEMLQVLPAFSSHERPTLTLSGPTALSRELM